jgi:hypothetical protein
MLRGTHFRPNGAFNKQMARSHRLGGKPGRWKGQPTHPFAKDVARAPKPMNVREHPVFRKRPQTARPLPELSDAAVYEQGAAGIWMPRMSITVPMFFLLAMLAGGCEFDTAGLRPVDEDAQVTDSRVIDSEVTDSRVPDARPDAGDAEVIDGEPPRITWPKIAQLTGGVHMNNRIFWRLKLPQTTPPGRQVVRAEIDRSCNGMFVETIIVDDLGHLHGSFDAVMPYYSHELEAYVVYDDETTSDSTTLTVGVDNSLAFRLDMNENQGNLLQDSSVNSHDATMVGGVTWVQDARGTGIAMDGTGYATFDDASLPLLDFDWNQPFTIVADVNRGVDGAWHAIYGRMNLDSSTARGIFFTFDNDDQLLLASNHDWAGGVRKRARTMMSQSITGIPSLISVADSGTGIVSGVMFTVNGQDEAAYSLYDDLAQSSTMVEVSGLLGAGLVSDAPIYSYQGAMYYLAIFKGRAFSIMDQRHENCGYLDSINAMPLPAYCD